MRESAHAPCCRLQVVQGRPVLLLGVLALLGFAGPCVADIRQVDVDAGTGGDGTSRATAFGDLQDGLAAADSGDAVWVAERPNVPVEPGGYRDISFILHEEVARYGGSRGDEWSTEQRQIADHPIILSGEADGCLRRNVISTDDNVHRVVLALAAANADVPTRLDGLIVTPGRGANDGPGLHVIQRGWACLTNCDFARNRSEEAGGGVAVSSQCDGRWTDNRCRASGPLPRLSARARRWSLR